jgi:hypothetical protein
MASPLQVDVSVYKGNIKVDIEYVMPGGDDLIGSYITLWVKEAEKTGKRLEEALIRLPFSGGVGIRGKPREGFSTTGGLHYWKTIYVDLSVEAEALGGVDAPVGDRFLEQFGKIVKSMGGELTNKGRRVARLAGRWIARHG